MSKSEERLMEKSYNHGYNKGYMKAKKDLALTAEDVSCIIHLADQFGKDYQKIANVFNKDREEEEK